VPKDSVAAKLLQKSQYFLLDEIRATPVVEKQAKLANDPRTRKSDKRKTPIEDLINETKTEAESKPAKDTTVAEDGQHKNTIAED
jgi:CRISPR/Cas system-associated endonuclease Cas1